jgi:hypothetical protein
MFLAANRPVKIRKAFNGAAPSSTQTAVKGTIRAGRRSAADEDTIAAKPDVTATKTKSQEKDPTHFCGCRAVFVPALARNCAEDEEPRDATQQFDGPSLVRLAEDHEAARNRAGLTRPEIRRLNHVSSPLIGV